MSDNSVNSNQYSINLQPIGRRSIINNGMTLLDAAQIAGVELTSICGGIGVCDGCKIRLISGQLSDLTPEEIEVFTLEEINNGFRLACQALPKSNVTIDIPPESLTTPQRLQVEGVSGDFEFDPMVIPISISLTPPSINDLRSDHTRLLERLDSGIPGSGKFFIDYSLLKQLSVKLRDYDWNVVLAMRNNRIIDIFPNSCPEGLPVLLGLAVDIGTTKLAGYLVNLQNGNILSKTGAMNPQIAFGEDVISRITYVINHPELDSNSRQQLLQQRLIDTLNIMISDMLRSIDRHSVDCVHIVDAVIVGNTAMHHLFAGLSVKQLGLSPYVPAVSDSMEITARDLGLHLSPSAKVFLPPNIAGYVGADHVAMLLASLYNPLDMLSETSKNIIALDIGTNTEISLLHDGQLLSCSAASGPAFEGAHILFGMRAAPGAIERVKITENEVRYKTIGDELPVGICGSGILDAVAEMLNAGILDFRGTLEKSHSRVRLKNNNPEFILADSSATGHKQDIVLTRRDVNEIQLAKGAIRAAIQILLREARITDTDLDMFIIAGAFGTYIDINSAIKVGMFPKLDNHKYKQIGNAAGVGARYMLLSKHARIIADKIAQKIQYIELSGHPWFAEEFSKALFFS